MLELKDREAIDKIRYLYIGYYKEGVISSTQLSERLLALDEVYNALEQVTNEIIDDMARRDKTIRLTRINHRDVYIMNEEAENNDR